MPSRLRTVYDYYAHIIAGILIAMCFLLAGATYLNDRNDAAQDRQRIIDNETNAVTGCANANESREASRLLWAYILDVGVKKDDATPDEVRYYADVRAWIDQIYAERDCTDLARKYPLPPPPTPPEG